MGTSTESLRLVRTPLYSYSEADRLADVSPGTSRRWLHGYQYWGACGERIAQPPVTPGTEGQGSVSFVDLMDVVAIGRLKASGLSVRTIRRIVENCQRFLGVERPLATLQFKLGGKEIFVDRGEILLAIIGRRKGAQAWNDILEPFLVTVEYEHDMARRWWPLGKDAHVVIDPDYGYGLPVVSDSGVRTGIIRERFEAGDLGDQIASDFHLDPVDVQRALQFEIQRAA